MLSSTHTISRRLAGLFGWVPLGKGSQMRWLLGLALLSLCSWSSVGRADVLYSGSSGPLAASANFATSGTDLVITLTNTSAMDVMLPAELLTSLFFDISGDPLLGTVSALIAGGSMAVNVAAPGGDVGGEWAYKRDTGDLSGSVTQNYGVSSVGLGIFGAGELFGGANLSGPAAPDGDDWGLLSAGDNILTGNAAILSLGLIKNSVVLTLSGLPGGFMANSTTITNVRFQYGSAIDADHPTFPGDPGPVIPEPSSVVLLGLGSLVSLAAYRHRSRRNRTV